MDNLTHSLAGAVLGQMGLKKKTGLGMATLIIAANIPDIDAVATLLDGHQHLAIRRGITHGPIAMLVLPLLLTGLMILFDRWQTKRSKRPVNRLPLHKGWLLALAYIGTLSHPALDWLNSYGIRLLEPFSSQWFYGDSIFIIDIWIWAALIAGVWISRRREKKDKPNWQRPAWISFAAIGAYIFANGLITGKAEAETAQGVEAMFGNKPDHVVANPVPVTFWKRDMIWQQTGKDGLLAYGETRFDLFDGEGFYFKDGLLENDLAPSDAMEKLPKNKDISSYLFWSRMPVVQWTKNANIRGEKDELYIGDMRFRDPMVGDRFSIRAKVEPNENLRVEE